MPSASGCFIRWQGGIGIDDFNARYPSFPRATWERAVEKWQKQSSYRYFPAAAGAAFRCASNQSTICADSWLMSGQP